MKRRALLGLAGASMASLAGCLGGATEYTVTDVRVRETSGPLSLDVMVRKATADIEGPARLEITVTNENDRPVRVQNIGIWPFGLLALAQSAPGTAQTVPRTILWSDEYEKSKHVHVDSRRSFGVDGKHLTRTLNAGESATDEYKIYGNAITQPGTYYMRGDFEPPLCSYRLAESRDWESYLPTVAVAIEKQGLVPSI